jgi:uncharacterized membrane protein YcaP (DUF421 family)
MNAFWPIDWRAIFLPSAPVAETFLRGTLVYLFLFAVLRLLRREADTVGISDLLVVVLVADATQNAMAGDYKSVTDGAILVVTVALWDYLLGWLGYR